jgi:hypothetical protein
VALLMLSFVRTISEMKTLTCPGRSGTWFDCRGRLSRYITVAVFVLEQGLNVDEWEVQCRPVGDSVVFEVRMLMNMRRIKDE